MPVDVASHPNYGPQAAKFRAAREAATTAGDDVALARADAEWANSQAEMRADLYERQDAERTRQSRMDKIKSDYPNVPDNVLEGITDLDQAERIAKSFQEVAGTRPQQNGGTWSPPPGGSNAAGTPAWQDIADPNERAQAREDERIKRLDELSPTVMKKGALAREENEEVQRLALQPLTDRFQPRT